MKIKELLSEAPNNNPEVKRIRAKITEWRNRINDYRDRYMSTDITSFGKFTIEPDERGGYGIVHTGKVLTLHEWMFDNNGELELKFISCNLLRINGANVKSFKNFPERILNNGTDDLYPPSFDCFYKIHGVTSLEGVPKFIRGNANFTNFENISFSNAHKHITHVDRLTLPLKYKGPVLSLLKIPGLKHISNHPNSYTQILNKHLASSSRDIIACQEELIDNGYKDYAEL